MLTLKTSLFFRKFLFDSLYKAHLVISSNILQQFLSGTTRFNTPPKKASNSARQLIKICEKIPQIQQETVQDRIHVLVNAGFKTEDILQHPEILSRSSDAIGGFITMLRDISLKDETILKLLTSDDCILNKCISTCMRDLKIGSVHRISFLVNTLSFPEEKIVSHLQKYSFIFALSFAHIRAGVEILLYHNIKASDILSDPWILRCRTDKIKSRLEKLEMAEVENKKPWMARCTDEVFDRFMTRVSTEQKLLGESSLVEYLSQRLGCSAEEMKELIDREPQLQKTSVLKMKKILDFLFASGFEAGHIIAGLPRVANRRIETIHSRLLEINQLGIPPSIYVISKSKREYQLYVNKRKNREN